MRGYNTFANRGRDFEDFVIQVNDLYTRSGKAVVYKVPTAPARSRAARWNINLALTSWAATMAPLLR